MILNYSQLEQIKEIVGTEVAQEFLNQQKTDKDKEKKKTKRRENRDFTQVYPAGWYRLQSLINKDPSAARLYAFLAENMGSDGTLCASRVTLADALGCSQRTITRHIKVLEKEEAIITLKVGTANVYCLNPAEVWKSFSDAKTYAAFRTKTLVGKTENPFVKKRLATLIGKTAKDANSCRDDFDVSENVEEMITVEEK